jgi:hypothetical protein
MFATSVAYDLTFVIHVLAALTTLAVFLTLRSGARAVATGAASDVQRARFPQRRNWAARVLHVLPVTGLVLSLSGDSSVALSKPWVGVGLLMYLLAAGHLEARTLPQERALAAEIAANGVASPEHGRKMTLSIDVLLALVAVALVAMLVQF